MDEEKIIEITDSSNGTEMKDECPALQDETVSPTAENLPEVPEAAQDEESADVAEESGDFSDNLEEALEQALDEVPTEEPQEEAPDYVRMTLDSGIAPLELRYCQVNDCYGKLPVAYRTSTVINSVTMGVLTQEKYSFAADSTEQGIRLARWNICEAMKAIKKFEEAGRHIQWLSVRCPAILATEVDMYDWMKKLMEENDFQTPEKLCLEFPQSLLFEQNEKAQISVLNLKLLKVKSIMSGCAANDCPIGNLMDVPVDMVFLDESKTKLTGDRDKGAVISALLQYIRSMDIEIIAEGVIEDDQLPLLHRAECFGYIVSDDYYGYTEYGSKTMTLEEAIAQKEEDNGWQE